MTLNDIYQSLAIVYVSLPNAVTTYNDELVGLMPLKCTYVRLASNHLLMVPQLLLSLVIEVSKGTTQIEPSIDSTHINNSSCIFDSPLLLLTLRLMIQ